MKIITTAFALALAATAFVSAPAFARHGADDATAETRHGRGKHDGAGHAMLKDENLLIFARRGRGADDPAGDDRGGRRGGKGRGADDGVGHTSLEHQDLMIEARRGRGADDPAGDDRGGRRGGKGRGADDGVGHA